MKLAAAYALADCVPDPAPTRVLPSPLDRSVIPAEAAAVHETGRRVGVETGGA